MLFLRDEEISINPLTATAQTTRVVVSNYACMSITVIVLGVRAGLSTKWRRKLGIDDVLMLLALMAVIINSVLTEHAVRRGLGTFIRPGNSSRLERLEELMYAADLFFLFAMFLAKLSLIRTIYRFAPKSGIAKGKLMILQISVVCWILFSTFSIAFQCGTPMPWLYIPSRCAGSGALWYPTLIWSIFADAWLAVCAWPSLPDMQLTAKERQIATGLTGSRFLVCLLGIAQVALLGPALTNINQPRAMPNPTVFKHLVMNGSLITASIPLLFRPLAMHIPALSAHAVIYRGDAERGPSTPLSDIKQADAVALPHPNKFDGLVTETELKKTFDSHGDFSTQLSHAFNKDIGAAA